jgi:hypothetical protein
MSSWDGEQFFDMRSSALVSNSRNPEQKVDRFLSAPEEVVSNKRELEKLKDRKARDAARLARERAGKSKTPPTLEDLLADMVRVAEDPDTNPFHEFRSISSRRYELYGHYPIEFILKHGYFEHAKTMAGLAHGEGDRLLLRARTHQSKREHDERYFSRYIQSHIGKHPELTRETAKAKLAVWISDTHSMFMDPFTWLAFLAFIDDAQPDVIVWGGDHVDGSEISSHPQVPGHTLPFQVELDVLNCMWIEARERCPNARFVWLESNHFMPRFVRYLTQHCKTLGSMRTLRMDKILDFDGLDVEIVQPGTFLSPKGQEDARPAIKLWDRITSTHGTIVNKTQATSELLHWGSDGWSGHCHRDQMAIGPSAGLKRFRWLSCPGATIDQAAKYYVQGNVPAWSRGFAIAEMMGKGLQLTPAITTEGVCMVNGFYYSAEGMKLPTGVQPVRKFWEKRWNLPKKGDE